MPQSRESLSHNLSEIGWALQHLAQEAHLAKRPTWLEVGTHIEQTRLQKEKQDLLKRLPPEGLKLDTTQIASAIGRVIEETAPHLSNQESAVLENRRSPYLKITSYRPQDAGKEVYRILFYNLATARRFPDLPVEYGEGIIIIGSYLTIQIKDHHGLTQFNDLPNNTLTSSTPNYQRFLTMRALDILGLLKDDSPNI